MSLARDHHEAEPLHGISVVSMAVNLPGPLAAARLESLGAAVTKVEPPDGDPAADISHDWYLDLIAGQDVVTLDLKRSRDRRRFDDLLYHADLLLTASRPAALARLRLSSSFGVSAAKAHTEPAPSHSTTPPTAPAPRPQDIAAPSIRAQAARPSITTSPPSISRTRASHRAPFQSPR